MPSIDRQWVYEQLTENKTKKLVGDAVLKLLDTWDSISASPEDAKKIVEIFSRVGLNVPIIERVSKDEVWVNARPGDIKVGDEVLVKDDAFTHDHAHMHNGRRCRVVAIRYGDIICNSIDGAKPELLGSHYSPAHLLKLVSK